MSEARLERRLAAILAVDVSGYSRLMGEDEEGTLAALRSIRRELGDPKIKEHRGRIVKTTGDGLLVEFASVVDAVRCAVETQREMASRNAAIPPERRIEFRMGINLGDIIVEDGDIFGDGVNIAARLEALAEPGEICVSRVVRDQVRDKLDFSFADMGEQQVKNIARPVRVYSIGSQGSNPQGEAQEAPPGVRALALPEKPSLVVLPFQNMTGDAEQEYFVDGMVEEITTAISRLPWLFVIARNSAFTYKGKATDVKQVAQELGVRYVLEGSVRKAGSRVRITGQLIDTATSAHIWADRFDSALDDIFDLQDQVASSVAAAIEPKLRQSEIDRAVRKPTESLSAYDLYLHALAQSNRWSDDGFAEGVTLARQALAIDPSYAPAAAMLSWCRTIQHVHGWGSLSGDDITEAILLSRRALEAARDDPDTVWQAAYTLFLLGGEASVAEAMFDRALTLNPNAAMAWNAKGNVLALRNRPDAAIDALERARRLSPNDPNVYWNALSTAIAHFAARRFGEAIESADHALHDQPRFVTAMRVKTAAFAHLGLLEEARTELGRVLAIDPSLTIARYRAMLGSSVAPELFELIVAGLRRAGLPEG
jgi:adenylate cyclase